jgi:hypothetical protein
MALETFVGKDRTDITVEIHLVPDRETDGQKEDTKDGE